MLTELKDNSREDRALRRSRRYARRQGRVRFARVNLSTPLAA